MRNLHRPSDDYLGMTPDGATAQDRRVEALLTGHGEPADAPVLRALTDLRLFSAGPAPHPSVALTALLTGATPRPGARPLLVTAGAHRRRSARHPLRAVALSIVAGLSVLTASAAANALPPDAQRTIANFLNTIKIGRAHV